MNPPTSQPGQSSGQTIVVGGVGSSSVPFHTHPVTSITGDTETLLPDRLDAVSPEITNFDAVLESGWYSAGVADNAPALSVWTLQVIRYGPNDASWWAVQIAYEVIGDKRIYTRNIDLGFWSAWQQIDRAFYDTRYVLASAWSTYTPTLGGWTLGNGTTAGRYMQVGSTVHFTVILTTGSTTSYSGGPNFTLPPVPARTLGANGRRPVGTVDLFDSSGSAHRHYINVLVSTTACAPVLHDGTAVSPTVPWTWATGDIIELSGTYEAA